MGAGRKTETYTLAPDGQYASAYGMCTRNLQKGDLCGVIFGCKFSTIQECYAKKLFGLPAPHMAYIKNIDPGLTLFLFNYSDRTLHGIFEAASEGQLNIDPTAWSSNGTDPSPYPAQVKVRVRVRCEPLLEEKFSTVISENYKDEKMFWFELDRGQTNKLLRLFSPSLSPSARAPSTSRDVAPPSRKPIPASSLAQIGDLGATRVDKWSSLFKSSDESNKNKEKDSNGAGSRLVNLGKTVKTSEERKAQPSVSQHGASFSSVVRNMDDSSTLEKKTSSTNEVRAQATKRVENPRSSASRVVSSRQDSRGPSKEVPAEDTISEIDWDASSSFKVHLDGLNKILEDPKDKDCFKRFEGNMGQASSSMVPNSWEDEKISWDFDERNIAKSPCGSSYVSAATGEMGSPNFVDILTEILAEVKELKHTQMRQAERMISLEMDLIDSRREILRLKGSNGSY
ncbi:B2 protein [Cardamine amara subsp. amara]|uniref:B2 protein n=1 Tax=Cardamine amara subsp. amara TaxID=228776 RepID=A0ABD0ZKQ0_CARAN